MEDDFICEVKQFIFYYIGYLESMKYKHNIIKLCTLKTDLTVVCIWDQMKRED